MQLTYRRFQEKDADSLHEMIKRNYLEVNIKDYDLSVMLTQTENYAPDKIITLAKTIHLYVFLQDEKVVAAGAVKPYDQQTVYFMTIFVLPEHHGHGFGRQIMTVLEQDELSLVADKIILEASITAKGFYQKLGYTFIDGQIELNESDLYWMEKINKKSDKL